MQIIRVNEQHRSVHLNRASNPGWVGLVMLRNRKIKEIVKWKRRTDEWLLEICKRINGTEICQRNIRNPLTYKPIDAI